MASILNYPVQVSYHNLNIELPGLVSEFIPSLYTQQDQNGQYVRKFDLAIRNSKQAYFNCQKLEKLALKALSSYFSNSQQKFVNQNLKEWRIIKYDKGHFIRHCDYERTLKPYVHFGTLIALPPKTLCQYKNGTLKTWNGDDKKQINPHQHLWTFVIMPLGVQHEVTQVQGMRISYVSPVYIEDQGRDYSVPITSQIYQDNGSQPVWEGRLD